MNYGDQDYIATTLTECGVALSAWQDIQPKDWFLEFSFQNRLNPLMTRPPATLKLCYCLGAPKFDSYPQLPLVLANWV
jgi:hypothetical protein